MKAHTGTINWYNQNYSGFAEKSEKIFHMDMIEEFTNLLQQKSNPKILDIGCGSGRDTEIIGKLTKTQIIGLDASKNLIEYARKKHPNCKFILGDFFALPFSDNEIDGVWAHASFVHVESKKQFLKALRESIRVLKKGGLLHLLLTPISKDEEKVSYFKKGFFASVDETNERVFYRTSENEITEFSDKLGFEILHLEEFVEGEKYPGRRMNIKWLWVLAKKNL